MINSLQALLLFAFPALVIVGALKDATSYTIPNWVSLALVGLFFPAAFALGLPLPQFGLALAVGFVALLAAMGMFALGWIGGGDAKLFAATALWLGWQACMPYLLVTGVVGGLLALGLLGLRSVWLRPYTVKGPGWIGRLAEPGGSVPYGVAIAIGALAAFPGGILTLRFSGLW